MIVSKVIKNILVSHYNDQKLKQEVSKSSQLFFAKIFRRLKMIAISIKKRICLFDFYKHRKKMIGDEPIYVNCNGYMGIVLKWRP